MIKRQFARICQGGAVLTPFEFTYVYDKNYKDKNFGQNYMNFDVVVDVHRQLIYMFLLAEMEWVNQSYFKI